MGWRWARANHQVLTQETLLHPPPQSYTPNREGGRKGGGLRRFWPQPNLSLTPGELSRRGWSYLESFLPAGARPCHLRLSEDLQKDGVKGFFWARPLRRLLGLCKLPSPFPREQWGRRGPAHLGLGKFSSLCISLGLAPPHSQAEFCGRLSHVTRHRESCNVSLHHLLDNWRLLASLSKAQKLFQGNLPPPK